MESKVGKAVVDTQDFTVAETSGSQYGDIQIHNDVFSMIAHETATKVPGVVELSGSLVDGLAGIIGRKDKGIRVEQENENIRSINLTVVLEFGVCIPDICQQLQSTVKKAVEDMTGTDIYKVNVFVAGIRSSVAKKVEE
jgi:uncharacterized alkaline shock family protein YloU